MRYEELIKYQKLVDVIDWDGDIQKWTLRDDDLENLVFTTQTVCDECSNNPANGGSGLCNCVLGQQPIA